jgi:polar amino acid transport system ATP-binding protein
VSAFEIQVRRLCKSFGPTEVLRGVDFEVSLGEVVSIIGPSGSGKSTLLRCLNLLETPDAGEILWQGELVDYKRMSPAATAHHRTHMGMVFQQFNLFPHLTALGNVEEGPRFVLGLSRREARTRAERLLERVGLGDRGSAWPAELSGGQKQRVAIARALAMEPRVLLLDEVTSALDVEMVAGVNELLAEIAREGTTMVAVTHDLAFARAVSSRLCFMDEGLLVEKGPPDELLERPSSARLQEFLGAVLGQGA